MKRKFIIMVFLILLMALPAYAANKFWWATGYTGGGSSLDGIDGASLTDGDGAIVVVESAPGTYESAFYILDDDDAAESSPDVIVPDANPGTWAWHKLTQGSGDVTGVGDCASGACGDGSSDGGSYYRLYDSGGGFYNQIAVPTLAANRTFTLPNFSFAMPTADGTSGHCLKTYANGTSYFEDCGAGGDVTSVLDDTTGAVPLLYDAPAAFSSTDTTPDVSGGMVFITANASATTIDDFDAGAGSLLDGQLLFVIINDALTTFDFSSSGLEGLERDYTAANGDLLSCVYTTTDSQWHCNLLRKMNFVDQDEYDNGNSSTADTIVWANGNKQKSTLTDNCTFTFTYPSTSGTLLLRLVQDGTGSRIVTWPATVNWPGDTAPTLTTTANAVDIVSCYYVASEAYCAATLNYTP